MARKTVYNSLTDEVTLSKVNKKNKSLVSDFVDYLRSTDHSETTIYQYTQDLNVFFCWNYKENDDKEFVNLAKRDIIRLQRTAMEDWKWSTNRLSRFKSTLSSLSIYIENILDDEYPNFRPIIHKIPNPPPALAREKTVFTDEELEAILNTLIKDGKIEQMAALALAMYSGRRKAELLLFKMSYFTDDCVISGSLYKTPEKIKTKGRGTKGKLLNCYTVKKGFDPYFKIWQDYRKEKSIDSDWYMYNPDDPSSPITISSLDSYAKTISRYTDKPFYFHACRHYACSHLMSAGLPATVVKNIFGWSDLGLVDLYYDRNVDDEIAEYFKDGEIVAKNATLSDI